MKISELIEILQNQKDKYGEADVRIWDDESSTMSLNLAINDFLSDSDGGFQGRVAHFVGIGVESDNE